jgi:hypothetical protein
MTERHLKLVGHDAILDQFAAQLAARCGELWGDLSEPVRDYYRGISREALVKAGAEFPEAAPRGTSEDK